MFVWNIDPEIIKITDSYGIRWYGLLFVAGFIPGYFFMRNRFREAGYADTILESLVGYIALGVIVGARLGHCLFYDPSLYLSKPWKILFIWEGGLASHGGAIGLILALWLFVRKNKSIRYLWLTDHMAIPTGLAAASIRLGNLMNSEIIGKPTEVPWAIIFKRIDLLPRHPAQLYESICYLIIATIMFTLYKKTKAITRPGLLMGVFFICVFGTRFFIEFIKEVQEPWERGMLLNMGQILSIPIVLIAIWLVFRALTNPPVSLPVKPHE